VLKRDVSTLTEYKAKTLELLKELSKAQTEIAVLRTRVDALKESVDSLGKQINELRSASRIIMKEKG
jgi:cell division protein FtsL